MTEIPALGWIELGHDVAMVFTAWRRYEHAGLIHSHRRPDNGQPCAGGIMFDLPGVAEEFPGRPLWDVVVEDPLTLHPSLLCRDCGHHGWIRSGRWEPA